MNAISASRNSQMLCASFGASAAATRVRASQRKLQFLKFFVKLRPDQVPCILPDVNHECHAFYTKQQAVRSWGLVLHLNRHFAGMTSQYHRSRSSLA